MKGEFSPQMLRLVRGVARIPERRRTDDGASRHGDAAIAAVLAYAASRAEFEAFGYEAAPPAHLRPAQPTRWRNRRDDFDDEDKPAGGGWMPSLRGTAW